jgi:pimeloyl-ACP methyl ester carboxylesterase
MTPFRIYQGKLEKNFIVVHWDQRGTGKSFSRAIPRETMTIKRFVDDAYELVHYLRREFKKDKILLVGHSWGSALGLILAKEHPELFYAFVGSGQLVAPQDGEQVGYHYVLEKGREHKVAMKQLVAINHPESYLTIDPEGNWFSKLIIQKKWLLRFGGELYHRSNLLLLFNFQTIFAPEYAWMDLIRFFFGSVFSLKTMWPEVMRLNFFKSIPRVDIPVFFFEGRHDYNQPASLLQKYYMDLQAPSKELVWFEESAHHPMYEEPEKYTRCLVEKVLPICR